MGVASERHGLQAIPGGIWALGFVSLCMDTSSELIHSLLPVFMVSVLGASALVVGLVEGVAESAVAVTKLFSGVLSDYLGRRKLLTVVGYGLAAATKPLFALAPTIGWVFAARFTDRVGKGIRGAPRDALIADLAPPHVRGAAYGLRQSLDTAGAVLGPLAAMALMVLFAGDFRAVFWVAVIPALAAVAILIVGVKEPAEARATDRARSPIAVRDLARLGLAYWWVVAIGTILTLARFSEAFLVLRAEGIGLDWSLVPLVMVVMSGFYAVSAYPAGRLSDWVDRRLVLAAGLAVLIAADLVLGWAQTLWPVMFGVALWGLHMGLTQGLLAALVADTAAVELRGSAFGLFNLVTGAALLAASAFAGALWHVYGPPATFFAGAFFTALALAALLALHGRGAARPSAAGAGTKPR